MYPDLKSTIYSLRTLTTTEGFLDGEWQGNHMHFSFASNAWLSVINWNAIAGEKMSRKERTAPIKSTSQQLNQIQPLSVQDWYKQQLAPKKKDFRRTEHKFEWMSVEEWFIWALIPRLCLETPRSSEPCNHELWFHNCWLSLRRRFMYSQSSPRETEMERDRKSWNNTATVH